LTHSTTIGSHLRLKDLGLNYTRLNFTCYHHSSPITPLLNSLQSKYSTVIQHFQFLVSTFVRYLTVVHLRSCHISVYIFLAGHFIAIYLTSQKLVDLVELTPFFIVLELFMLSALLSLAKIVHFKVSFRLFIPHYFWSGGIFLHDATELYFIL